MPELYYEVISPSDADPLDVVFMPNILGGALQYPGGHTGDHRYRAQYLANALASHVIAYERPGTGRGVFDTGARAVVQPDDYVSQAMRRAASLQKAAEQLGVRRAVIVGPSAAGTEAIALAQTEAMQLDTVAVYDPIGTSEHSWSSGFLAWSKHQKLEGQRPARHKNQHPMESPGQPRDTINAIAGLARTAMEMYRYGNTWRHETAYDGLRQLIHDRRYGHIALLGVFPEQTFTDSASNNRLLALEFQAEVIASTRIAPTEFRTEKLYHSWTDDPANLAKLTHEAQLLAA